MRIILKRSSDGFGSIILHTKPGSVLKYDCFLNTNKFCLLCITKLAHKEGDPPPPTHSLEWIPHDLGMDFVNVLKENGIITDKDVQLLFPQLNEKGVNFNATLCSDCLSITDSLTVSCDLSGEIRNEHEVITSLTRIQSKMEEVNESEKMDEFYKLTKLNPDKIQDAEVTSIGRKFRKEINCALKVYLNEEQQRRRVTLEQHRTHQTAIIDSHPITEDITEEAAQVESEEDDPSQLLNAIANEPPSSTSNIVESPSNNNINPIDTNPIPSTSKSALRRSPRISSSVKHLSRDGPPSHVKLSNIAGSSKMKKIRKVNKNGRKPRSRQNHNRIKSHSGKQECVFCRKEMWRALLETHLLLHIGEKPYFCTGCDSTFAREDYFKIHLAIHVAQRLKPFQCHMCPEAFATSRALTIHQITHRSKQDMERFECIFCHKPFVYASRLELHILNHINEKPFYCQKCDDAFISQPHLNSHMKIHNPARKRIFRCETDTCSKKFFSQVALNLHRAIHQEERLFGCDSCPSTFKTRARLLAHKRWIHMTGAVKCDTCGKCFDNKPKLRAHNWRAHKYTYPCKICDKGFSGKNALQMHSRLHVPNQERPFKCDFCGRGFFDERKLEKHSKRHRNQPVRPFKCEICEKCFRITNQLKRHEERHENGKKISAGDLGKSQKNLTDRRKKARQKTN